MTLDVVALTQSLIRCPSVTPDDHGAQDVLITPLKDMGFTIDRLTYEGSGGTYPVQNFFARLGTGGPHLCYNGHTDVVPPGDEAAWTYPPFSAEIVNGKMYGRGTSDMKGANAAFIVAVSEYLAEYGLPKGSISIAITGDEEAESINGTAKMLEWMIANNHTPDMCLVGESSNIDYLGEEIKIGRRGSFHGYLTVKGIQGHVAYPHLADNPLHHLVKFLDMLAEHRFDSGSAHFPATNLEITTIDVGNKSTNVIPAQGTAHFNIRFNDRWTCQSLDKEIRRLLDIVSPQYELKTVYGSESFFTTPGHWTETVSSVVESITGHKPELSTKGGTSDARFFKGVCPVVEFGLTNKTIHKVDEHLELTDLLALVKIYKAILVKVFS